MVSRRAVTALVLVQLIAFAVAAQDSTEFGANGGRIVVTPKGSSSFSGSLELSMSSGSDVFGRGSSPGYGVTTSGSLLQDRLWFFGSASGQEMPASRLRTRELPENGMTTTIGARAHGRIGAGHDLSASFAGSAPSSFLSLRYSGIVSSNMLIGASVTRGSRTRSGMSLLPAAD